MPVTTNLTFADLQSCLAAEEKMRKQWADHWNAAKKAGMTKEALDMIFGQVVRGTYVPHSHRRLPRSIFCSQRGVSLVSTHRSGVDQPTLGW